jgi:hypothetical protein
MNATTNTTAATPSMVGAGYQTDAAAATHAQPSAVPELSAERRAALLEQSSECGQSHRLHVTLMFGQMTVFLAAIAGTLSQVLGNANLSPLGTRIAAAIGCFVSLVFLVHHERMYRHSFQARSQAAEAHRQLGIAVYGHVRTRLPRAAVMSKVLYIGSACLFAFIAVVNPASFRPRTSGDSPANTNTTTAATTTTATTAATITAP